jgi:flavodoxin
MSASLSQDVLLVVYSYHHGNTAKVAQAMAEVLNAAVVTPSDVTPNALQQARLIGLGSGIYSARHHDSILQLAAGLPSASGRDAFIFSTFGAPGIAASPAFVLNNHSKLREILQSKGYRIVGEFGCAGFNTNSFLHWFGGLNKGRPNDDDLERAREFARTLKQKLHDG